MTDRELLELAAKAAGLNIVFKRWSGFYRSAYLSIRGDWTSRERAFVESKEWNPLTDDGDALRLAVKLNLPIHRSYLTDERLPVVACHKMYVDVHEEDRWQWIFVEDDSCAATRRAIVRAAAEIGKDLE